MIRIKQTGNTFVRWVVDNKVAIAAIVVLVIAALMWLAIVSAAPSTFPRNVIVRIDKNMTISEAAQLLKNKEIIKSVFLFKVYSLLVHNGGGIQAGSYLFDQPESVLRVAYRAALGIKNIQKVKITVLEGTNSKQIAALIKKRLPDFDSATFLAEARPYEGYLFPETYFIDPDNTVDDILDMMREQFDKGIRPLEEAIATSSHPLEQIITMASIIEEEASNSVDRRIISGILWKRIEKGMPLQVDVPFYYILGKGSSQLTRADLATTSPYNTYKYKGLPPGPISSPGLDAIDAALHPTPSPYYFYLADRLGVTHYAATHDGHIANIAKYLQ
jgi:UPF0755 protein